MNQHVFLGARTGFCAFTRFETLEPGARTSRLAGTKTGRMRCVGVGRGWRRRGSCGDAWRARRSVGLMAAVGL